MLRRLGPLVVLVGALALVPSASAAYPAPYAAQDTSLLSLDGTMHFVVNKAGSDTLVSAVKLASGKLAASQTIPGSFGIPMLTQSGYAGGLFHDGSAFVLQSMGLEKTSKFVVVGTQDLAVRDTVALDGTFGFDALSPDGSKLYLIQHTSTQDVQHYVVRAYDLADHTLMAGRIADKSQKSWVMQGWAVSRVTSPNGRWAYTLYANPGGYPFIHALDTVRGVAHCIGLPWKETANADPVYQFSLALKPKYIVVRGANAQVWRLVNRTTWRVSTK